MGITKTDMIKVRIIPLLLLKDGMLKKPLRFTERPRTVANPITIVRVFEARQVDELILLDIGCAERNSNVNLDIVRMIFEELTVPFTCGGGIRSLDTISNLISAGAEKIVLNTGAFENHDLITLGASKFGRQCIVVSIDAKQTAGRGYEVFINNGTTATGKDPVDWAREAQNLGAGEILINSIDRDGTMEGYDLQLIRQVSDAVKIPVIAAGGASEPSDCARAILEGHASAVAAGSLYHFRGTTPNMVRDALALHKIPVRMHVELEI